MSTCVLCYTDSSGDKCNDASRGPFEMKPATTDLDPPAEQCIALDGMKSFMPTIQPEEDTGSYCYLAFDDKQCDCIKNARLIVIGSNSTEVACETVEVADRHSYHFQLEDPDVSRHLTLYWALMFMLMCCRRDARPEAASLIPTVSSGRICSKSLSCPNLKGTGTKTRALKRWRRRTHMCRLYMRRPYTPPRLVPRQSLVSAIDRMPRM